MKSLLSFMKAPALVLAGTLAFSSISYAQEFPPINFRDLPAVKVEERNDVVIQDGFLGVAYNSAVEKHLVIFLYDLKSEDANKTVEEIDINSYQEPVLFMRDENDNLELDSGELYKVHRDGESAPAYCPIPGGKFA